MIRGLSTTLFGWEQRYRRDGVRRNTAEVLDDCATAGLDAVEIDPVPEVRAVLDARGLRVSGGYLGLPLGWGIDADTMQERVLPFAARLAAAGATEMVVNTNAREGLGKSWLRDPDRVRQLSADLGAISDRLAGTGLRLALHNHCSERDLALGELRAVLDCPDGRVGLCLDIGWAHVAGLDVPELAAVHGKRIVALHLRNQRGGVPTEDLLEGDLDVGSVVRGLVKGGYRGWMTLELWHPGGMVPSRSMLEDVRRSVDYVREAVARA